MKKRNALLLLAAGIILSACGNNESDSYIEATGTIESTNVTVSSKNSGEIINMLVDEGSLIAAGDTILLIDNEATGYQLKQAEASVKIAEAQLGLMLKGARTEDIKLAEENTKQSLATYNLAKEDYIRYTKLWEAGTITKKQFDEIKTRFQISEAQLSAANENYEKVKKIFRPEEIDQADANLQKAKASTELLKKNIRDSYVVSPVGGTVTKKFVEKGETVTPMSSLVKISDLSKVYLTIYVPETELGKIKPGQRSEITIDTFPDRTYEGRVSFISPEAEFTPKNIQTKDERTKLVFAVKIEISNKNFELKPGMPADARIIL